jgi:hypothetical protein
MKLGELFGGVVEEDAVLFQGGSTVEKGEDFLMTIKASGLVQLGLSKK